MLRPVHRRGSGFSLVELMISITVGLVVLAGVTTMFVQNVKAGGDTLKMARLNQELQATMSLMTRDIRRAGYWGNASSSIGTGPNANPFTLDAPGNYGVEAAGSCITFSYDRDGDGNIDVGSGSASPANNADERFGFRLRSGEGVVETRQSGAACTAGGWEDLTDTVNTEITGLTFTPTTKSVDLDGPATPSSPEVCVTGCGTSTINVREVTITLSGRLRKDAGVSRVLQDKVRVHNDLYQP